MTDPQDSMHIDKLDKLSKLPDLPFHPTQQGRILAEGKRVLVEKEPRTTNAGTPTMGNPTARCLEGSMAAVAAVSYTHLTLLTIYSV